MRNDMLPGQSEKDQVVEDTKSPEVKEDVKTPEAETEEEEAKVEIPKGYVPYDALHAERQKRKELEAKLKEKESSTSEPSDDVYSDEGKMLQGRIDALTTKISSYEKKDQETKVYSAYPILKDKREEFQDYLEENPELSLEKAAKLFLFENNLASAPVTERKGLERPTGGSKKTPAKGFTQDDLKRLRETEPRKHIKLIRSGKINPDDIE